MHDLNLWQSKFQLCRYSQKLLQKVNVANNTINQKLDFIKITKGIYYAKKYHKNQLRESGEPYYTHPIEVACMLIDYTTKNLHKFLRTDIVITCLLHDCIEDTVMSKKLIEQIFDNKIAIQVESLTKIKNNHRKITSVQILESLFQQKQYDLLLIKFFDRLHNIKTLYAKSPKKIQKTVTETSLYFIPLAKYLNLHKIGNELQILCKQYRK